MRIVIQIDDAGAGEATITADSGTLSFQPEPARGDVGAGEASDAGAPAEGQPLGPLVESEIGGQAIDAGSAPAFAATGAEGTGRLQLSADEGELIDAGSGPELDV